VHLMGNSSGCSLKHLVDHCCFPPRPALTCKGTQSGGKHMSTKCSSDYFKFWYVARSGHIQSMITSQQRT
jgi:hypothetical protein